MSLRELGTYLLILGLGAIAGPGLVASERVVIVTPDEGSFEEYAAAVYLEYHLGRLDGVKTGILTDAELTPSIWRRLSDRWRGRERFYNEPDVRIWVGSAAGGERRKTEGKRRNSEIRSQSNSARRAKEQERSTGCEAPGVNDFMLHHSPFSLSYSLRKEGRDIKVTGEGSALMHGVHGLLQDHLGFRWYLPGPLGEHVPEVSLAELGDFEETGSPGFRSRQFSGLRVRESREWAVNNRMERPGRANRRYRFHHNVRRIFTPDLFDEHPEIFPLWDGERYRPPENDPNWQPCFGNPKTAEIAVEAARDFFDGNPGALNFSVGMNDGNRICECGLCQELVAHGRTFRDKPDYSDLVFTFTNRVAELLEETHPDKYVGCLAYHWAENTPSFSVHPQVIPYLTADRSQWIDERFRNEDRNLIERWVEAGPEKVGIYDYYYGGSFVIPRVFNKVMAESIRHAHRTGVRGFYAELYPRWSLDGPKAWLASQLLWDPEASPEALLDDYYEGFFGPAAGPMRKFFELAEERWANQEGKPYWLRYYFQIAQLELYPPEVCAAAREILVEAMEAAGTREPYRERIELFAEGFRLTEFYSRYYHFVKELPSDRELSEEAGWRLLVDLMVYAEDFRELVRWKETVMDRDSMHREGGDRFYRRASFKPEMRLSQWVAPLRDWGKQNGGEELVAAGLDRLEMVFPAAGIDIAREIDRRERAPRPAVRNLLANGNFSADRLLSRDETFVGARGRAPYDWELWWRPGTSPAFFLDDDDAYTGSHVLRAEGAVEDFAYVNAATEPEALYRFSAHAKARISNGGQVRIELLWWAEDGSLIEGQYKFIDQLPEGETNDWNRMEVVSRPPEGAVAVMAALSVENQAEADWAIFDVVRLEEWGAVHP